MPRTPNLTPHGSTSYEGFAIPKSLKLNCDFTQCTAGQPYALEHYLQGKQLVAKVGENALK